MSELKRYVISYWDDDCEVEHDIIECEAGEWCQAADALREIATRDARIAELEAALRELVENMSAPIGDDSRLGYVTVQVERDAYHAAKQLLGGDR